MPSCASCATSARTAACWSPNKDNADIHAIVYYKNLGMPVHDDAPTHMHQILLLQRWLNRNCEPTPVPDA